MAGRNVNDLNADRRLRSDAWFRGTTESPVQHRLALRQLGIVRDSADPRPVIGIAQSAGEVNPCNADLVPMAAAVKRGVWAAGGIPLEFPTITLGEDLMKPTAMLYRNLMAIDVEESLRSYPFDGVVLLANCDKTIPAQLMASASADLPAIMLTGGVRRAGVFDGVRLGGAFDLWRYADRHRVGELSNERWAAFEGCMSCSTGACNVMGTAATMAGLAEVLGMMPFGTSSLTTGDSRLIARAEAAGRRIVGLVRDDVRPSRILTEAAFHNAIIALAAMGGSTNAVIHLCAIAGRRGIRLDLDRFDRLGRGVPVLADVAPTGRYLIDDYEAAGGLASLLAEIGDLLLLDAGTVTGETIGEVLEGAVRTEGHVIRNRTNPISDTGAIAVLYGNLAPDGAVMKVSAASREFWRHRGPAFVFDSYEGMLSAVDDRNLPVTADSVLVFRGIGPVGGPGMPEWGMIPIPRSLLERGIKDIVRISDGRMSGTSFGTCLLHVAPEAAVGGPIACVQTGDLIELDIDARSIRVDVSDEELERRRAALTPVPRVHRRGWPKLYIDHVQQAPAGCDLDFLVPDAEGTRFVDPIVGRS